MSVTRAWVRGCGRAGLRACGSLLLLAACSRGATKSADQATADSLNAPGRSAVSGAAPQSTGARQRILFVGTSLTAGLGLEADSAYPALIQQKIDSAGLPFETVNAGVSGETTAGLLERLDWLLRGDFAVLVLETGANDGLRGVPVSAVKENLRTALERIRAKRPDARIALIQMEALPNLGPTYAREFHAIYADLARQENVTLLPFLLNGVAGKRSLNQNDGIHPNYEGEHIVADNVWRGLRPLLAAAAPSA